MNVRTYSYGNSGVTSPVMIKYSARAPSAKLGVSRNSQPNGIPKAALTSAWLSSSAPVEL
jgi:hypothetical protein